MSKIKIVRIGDMRLVSTAVFSNGSIDRAWTIVEEVEGVLKRRSKKVKYRGN